MSDIPFGPNGFVDMDAFPPLDPEEALPEEVYERLREALVEAPVRVPSESQWTAMLETAVQQPPVDTDWLVPPEAPMQGDTDHGSTLDSADVDTEVYDDLDWPGLADELIAPSDDGGEDSVDGEGDGGRDDLF